MDNISIRMRIQGVGVATFDMRVRFYRNDGPGGFPGELLWDSGSLPKLIDSGADLSYPFTVPDVRVPSTFTYSVQVSNRQLNQSAMGPALYTSPTIGSASTGYWRSSGLNIGDWVFIANNDPPFGASVTAETIPGDVDHDATVDVDDLVEVILAWGRCPDCDKCPADVAPPGAGDCAVDVDDLITVILNWG